MSVKKSSLGSRLLAQREYVKKSLERERARRKLLNFILYTKADYTVNWHHKLICEEIDDFLNDPTRTRLMIFTGPRRGKAMCVKTPVLTTKGWKPHGNLEVGDEVFGTDGRPVKVLAVGKKLEMDTAVEFTTGEVFHTHSDHEWVFHKYNTPAKVYETKALGTLLKGEIGKRGSAYLYKTPSIKHLQFTKKELGVDPYTLGYWVGNKGFPEALHLLSIEQRLELLSGLIDSGGWVDTTGRVGFSSTNKSVVEGVKYLVRSFGWWCSEHYGETKLSSSGIQGALPVSELSFVPDIILPLRIESKRSRLKIKKQVRRIAPTKVTSGLRLGLGNCIQVEGGIYLVGRTLVPTHNSEIISRRLPAYVFGKNPNLQIIATSYGAELAQAMNRDVQRVIDSKEYKELFPATTLSGGKKKKGDEAKAKYVRTSDKFEIVGYAGSYRSAGIGGGITGQGADIALIDDPFKDWQEASSQKRRQLIKDWYSSTLYTRLSPNAKIIIINTRWHEDDLSGWLLKEAEANPEADQWDVISLPEVQDEHNEYPHSKDLRKSGEVLWPTRFTETIVAKIKASVGSKIWSALFQQRPSPDGGQIIKGEWFRYYKELPQIEYYMATWDCAFKDSATADYVVGQVWGVCGSNKYLVYMVRERLDIIGTIREMLKAVQMYPLRATIIEDKANGPAIISMLKNKVAGLIPFEPEGSKEARANACAPQFEAGNVWLPDKYYAPHRQNHATVIALLDAYVNEFKSFPNGAHDDMVDATTQILLKIGHKVNWLEELLLMAANKENVETNNTENVADIMGWNIQEQTTSIFDNMEDDLFNIDI